MFTDFDRLLRGKLFGGRLAAVIQFVNPKTFERNRERHNIVVHSIRSLMSNYDGTFYTLHDYTIVLFARLSERFFDLTFEKLVLELDATLPTHTLDIRLPPGEAATDKTGTT